MRAGRRHTARRTVALLALAAVVAVAGALLVFGGEFAPSAATLPPVYLTIVSHNEEPLNGRPDYTADPTTISRTATC